MKNPKFITLEGIEGAGKSTAMGFCQQFFTEHNWAFIGTREPGGTSIGEQLRAILLTEQEASMSSEAEMLMMFAARAQHLYEKIQPALAKGQSVLCDRFTDSSYAYQGGGRGIDKGKIATLETWVQEDFRPDLVLIFDLPVEMALARLHERGKLDRIESEAKSFFERVRQAYLDRAQAAPEHYRIIDTSVPLPAVEVQIRTVLSELMS